MLPCISVSEKLVLKSINLVIPIGSRVAFVGATGSGKSTTAALLLGLFLPKIGFLNLDGIPLALEDVQAWHACCSEVPQNIHLLDDSVYANVAFGLEEDQIDFDRVWEALEAAQLLELVDDLPFGIHTHVGENRSISQEVKGRGSTLARHFLQSITVLDSR